MQNIGSKRLLQMHLSHSVLRSQKKSIEEYEYILIRRYCTHKPCTLQKLRSHAYTTAVRNRHKQAK